MKTQHLLIGAGVLLVAYLGYTKYFKKKMAITETKPEETATTTTTETATVTSQPATANTTTVVVEPESGGFAAFAGSSARMYLSDFRPAARGGGSKSGQSIRIDTYKGHVNQGQ